MRENIPAAPMLEGDNTAAIQIAEDNCSKTNIRHVMLKVRFIQEQMIASKVVLKSVRTWANRADLFTKGLEKTAFQGHVKALMLTKLE